MPTPNVPTRDAVLLAVKKPTDEDTGDNEATEPVVDKDTESVAHKDVLTDAVEVVEGEAPTDRDEVGEGDVEMGAPALKEMEPVGDNATLTDSVALKESWGGVGPKVAGELPAVIDGDSVTAADTLVHGLRLKGDDAFGASAALAVALAWRDGDGRIEAPPEPDE